jgi:hypothetical protein
MPGMPSTPKAIDGLGNPDGTGMTLRPSLMLWLCQPVAPTTRSPSWNLGCLERTTRLTAPPVITSSIATGAA